MVCLVPGISASGISASSQDCDSSKVRVLECLKTFFHRSHSVVPTELGVILNGGDHPPEDDGGEEQGRSRRHSETIADKGGEEEQKMVRKHPETMVINLGDARHLARHHVRMRRATFNDTTDWCR